MRWRPTGARGSRGARKAGQWGGATTASRVGLTRGEGEQEVDGGNLHGGGRGGGCTGGRRKQSRGSEGRRGSEEEDEREKVQGLMCKIEKIQGLLCKVKFPIDLKLK
jgi:hypothetical protein